jgi:ankyrin repeat protein
MQLCVHSCVQPYPCLCLNSCVPIFSSHCVWCICRVVGHGDDADTLDTPNNQTPLHYTCQLKLAECAEILLQNGANPTSVDEFLCTPLHYATRRESYSPGCVRLLLKFDADVDVVDENGHSPIQNLAETGYVE